MGEFGEFDSDFIQAPGQRPNPNPIDAEGIPVIDLSPIHHIHYVSDLSSINEALIKQIGAACRNWGFFQVVNHGVPVDRRERIESAAREFFGRSLEEKRKVKKDEVQTMGYHDGENTKNVRNWKEVFHFVAEDPVPVPASPHPHDHGVAYWSNLWPQFPPNFREVCEEYTKDMIELALKLMELIALSLGLPAKRFHGFFKDKISLVKLNYYPPCPSPDLALGVGRHTDRGALTVLAQDDVGGLQVKRQSDGEWVGVKPIPHAYIVNIGDIMQVWTNEIYKSVEHRVVVNTTKERLSIPLFLTPSHYTIVKPLEELTSEESPPKYRPYNWGKFLITREASSFKLNVANIHISDFKIKDTK